MAFQSEGLQALKERNIPSPLKQALFLQRKKGIHSLWEEAACVWGMLSSAKFSWSKLQLNQAVIRAMVALMGVLLHKEEYQGPDVPADRAGYGSSEDM